MVKYRDETGSIELVVLGLLAALVVVLAFPIFDPDEELDSEVTAPVNKFISQSGTPLAK